MTTSWSLLTLDEEARQFVGNAGYGDDLGRHYLWDETVPNHRRVAPGDLALLRDGDFVLGLGWIDEVSTWTGDKDRFRCPSCSRTGFKERLTRSPRFKCPSCQQTFDEPLVERLEGIKFFRADYERTWRPMDVPMPVEAIAGAYLKQAKQHAIRELDLDLIQHLLNAAVPPVDPWWKSRALEGFDLPSGHRVVLGRARIGQQRFRAELLARFGSSCAICGPLPPAMLEAAHLYRYAERPQHQVDGGLLLRRDLHALFDRGLLLIDPDAGWTVSLSPTLRRYADVWPLDGREVRLPLGVRPNDLYLRQHAELARAGW